MIVTKGNPMPDQITIPRIQEMTDAEEKISVITAYDYPTAVLVDRVGIEMVLVGDSVGDNILGYSNTVPVTLDEMLHHTKAVRRGIQRALLIGDMPFLSFQTSAEKAIESAGRFMKEGGVEAVKIEGGEEMAETIRRMVRVGISVMGHVGLTPQREAQLGGKSVQGRDEASARRILKDARAVEEAGAFAIVLETIPWPLAKLISERLKIPTIGIGSGPYCDGQVLVINDVLGWSLRPPFKHAKRYANLAEIVEQAVQAYREEIKSGKFPSLEEHSFKMKEEVYQKLERE
jgi:3-methyl-2-oxobutanoate hydroxymethyltransferase